MWSFVKSGPENSNSSSKLDEFFNSQNASTSVVREALQNSLDAKLDENDGPIRVRFSISNHPWRDFEEFAGTNESGVSLNDHTDSQDLARFAESFLNKDLRCLRVEDYGTKGLTGDTDKNNARSESNLVGFWWNDGITGKSKGTSGSHGVGKTTLTRVSDMSTFLAVTKRSDDSRTFLLGFSNLPFHQVNGDSYLGYGRFGKTIESHDDVRFMPIDDLSIIAKLSEKFGISRKETGLSILIPAVNQSVGFASILEAVLADYYWPILKGDLVVEIEDVPGNMSTVVNFETVDDALDLMKDSKRSDELNELIKSARTVLEMRTGNPNFFHGLKPVMVVAPNGSERAHVAADCFSPDNFKLIKQQFELGKPVGVSFSMRIEPVEGQPQTGIIELFLQKNEDDYQRSIKQFIRNKIVISEQNSGISSKFTFCFVVAEDAEMSDYLKLAEEPAHTKWFIGRLNDQKAFKSDWPLRFAMDLPGQMFRLLSGEDEQRDKLENVAADIFSISEPVIGTGKEQKGRKKRKKTVSPKIKVVERRDPLIRIEREDDGTGFSVVSAANLEKTMDDQNLHFPILVKIKTAYLTVRGNAKSFKEYKSFDFDMRSTIQIKTEPEGAVNVVEANANTLVLEVIKPSFEVSALGFDTRRDLLIKTSLSV